MARYTDAVCKLCRREGEKLYLKGERCYTGKCGVLKRKYAPGQHGMARKKQSEYGLQLREKQKVRRYYGVLEKQFAKYFEIAESKKGVTGENLLAILESRFDNVIYRLGFAMSRAESRQLVRHSHFLLNGRRVNISSILVKPGDKISIHEKSSLLGKIKDNIEVNSSRPKVKWLDYDPNTVTGTVLSYATKEDIEIPISEHLIVELYSK